MITTRRYFKHVVVPGQQGHAGVRLKEEAAIYECRVLGLLIYRSVRFMN